MPIPVVLAHDLSICDDSVRSVDGSSDGESRHRRLLCEEVREETSYWPKRQRGGQGGIMERRFENYKALYDQYLLSKRVDENCKEAALAVAHVILRSQKKCDKRLNGRFNVSFKQTPQIHALNRLNSGQKKQNSEFKAVYFKETSKLSGEKENKNSNMLSTKAVAEKRVARGFKTPSVAEAPYLTFNLDCPCSVSSQVSVRGHLHRLRNYGTK